MELFAMRFVRIVGTPTRLLLTGALLTAGATAGGLATLAAPAAADPNYRDRIAAAEQQLADLDSREDIAVERYDEAQARSAQVAAEAEQARLRVTAAEEELTALRRQLGVIVASAYRTGGSAELAPLLLADNVTDYLARAAYVDQLARSRGDAIGAVNVARAQLADQRAVAEAAVTRQQQVEREVAAAKDAIETDLATEQRVLADLQARQAEVERAATARAEAARRAADDAAASRAQEQAAAAGTSRQELADRALRSTGSRQSPPPSASGPAPAGSGGAGTAVATAYAELGKPYAYGAGGPGSFDCSGLTSFVWAAAGVSLGHFTGAQRGQGSPVPRGAEQPGDLVFFGGDLHHVGIYVGGGQMIHAPHSGDVVRLAPAFTGDYVGAVRP
jgi:peptidoglycan DL-endopeptidase CwlO